ncbi:hypothetical protein P9112_009595 [Eukaryota sp. TZLM1-RC]
MHFQKPTTEGLRSSAEYLKQTFIQRHGDLRPPSPVTQQTLPDQALLKTLVHEIGIPERQAKEALIATSNVSVDAALEHIWSQSQQQEPPEPAPQEQLPHVKDYSYGTTIEEALKQGYIEGIGEISTTPGHVEPLGRPTQHSQSVPMEEAHSSRDESGEMEHGLDRPTQEMEGEVAEKTQEEKKAEMLAKMKRISDQKKQKEKEEQRLREKQRREEGKSYAELKREIKEKERKKAMEEKMRERREQREYLAKVKEQVRLEKEARARESLPASSKVQGKSPAGGLPTSAPVQANPPGPMSKTDKCRVQVRIGGKPYQNEFSANATFREVKQWVRSQVGKDVRLMTMMPRKEVTEENRTLEDLGFVPAIALMGM